MHRIFGKKENQNYFDRKGAYVIPFQGTKVAIVKTPKGYFLLGGGLNNNETDKTGIERECLEEIGYKVLVREKICSAESYCFTPSIGYFHPIQTYYSGDLQDFIKTPEETDHSLQWVEYSDLLGKMYLEMQSWAIEQAWKNTK